MLEGVWVPFLESTQVHSMKRDLGPPRVNCWTGSSSSCPIGGRYMNQFVHKSHKVP